MSADAETSMKQHFSTLMPWHSVPPILLVGLWLGVARAEEQSPTPNAQEPAAESETPAPERPVSEGSNLAPASTAQSATSQSICLIIESAARANHLPLEFF